MSRTVRCVKLGHEAEGLEKPPLPGELGQRIFENISKDAWLQWMRLQTMIINENRLNLADSGHRQYLREQMENHLFGEGAALPDGYVAPKAS